MEWSRPTRTSGERAFSPVVTVNRLDRVTSSRWIGMKWNIARCLVETGCQVGDDRSRDDTAEDILSRKPDGVFLSNGPGDPEPLDYAVKTIQNLIGQVPIFGICLGHQLLGQALGGKTFKLKYGHRGANQPVINQRTGRVEITTQNHGFAVDTEVTPLRCRSDSYQLERSDIRGTLSSDTASLLGAISPGGKCRPARQHVSLQRVHQSDEIGK